MMLLVTALFIGGMSVLHNNGMMVRGEIKRVHINTSESANYTGFITTNNNGTHKMVMVSRFDVSCLHADESCKNFGMKIAGNNGSYWIKRILLQNEPQQFWEKSDTNNCTDAVHHKRVICKRFVTSMFRLSDMTSGHLGFTLNNVWNTLCINLTLSEKTKLKICRNHRTKLYSDFRQGLSYADYETHENDDNCVKTPLNCSGDEPQNATINNEEKYMENEDINLNCSVIGGIPKPVIKWMRQTEYLNSTSKWKAGKKTLIQSVDHLKLSRDDNKTLTCLVLYKNNTINNISITVTVWYKPIVDVTEYVEVDETENVVMKCNVSSNPPANITWSNPQGHIIAIGQTLNITYISRTAIGNYTCNGTNTIGEDADTTILHINAPPRMCLYMHGSTEENQTVTIRCAATGIPTPTISWQKDGNRINNQSSQHRIISQVSSVNQYLILSNLTVSGVDSAHDSRYTCNINNKNGNIQKTIRIHRKLLRCRCLARYLKRPIPLNYTSDEVHELIEKSKEELSVKKPKQKEMKLKCANNESTSEKYIGLLGILGIVSAVMFVLALDLLGFKYKLDIAKEKKRIAKKKLEQKKYKRAILKSNRRITPEVDDTSRRANGDQEVTTTV